MRKRPFQLSPGHRRLLYCFSGVLFLSGALWWLVDYGGGHQQHRYPPAEFLKPWLLKVHGAAAMVFLVVLGSLWPNHIRRAWHARANRQSGGILIAWIAGLTITGYGLYYFGGESVREWTAWLHDVLGFLSIALLILHIAVGRRFGRASTHSGGRGYLFPQWRCDQSAGRGKAVRVRQKPSLNLVGGESLTPDRTVVSKPAGS